MQAKLLLIHALSPLHAGTGQGVGVIDLPIAREKATGIPFLPGSSIKGVLRDACPEDKRTAVFGPDTNHAEDHAGSIQFADARLLLLPVRSLAGTFAWVTSPLLLQRFKRDTNEANNLRAPANIPQPTDEKVCVVANENCGITLEHKKQQAVILEDLLLTPEFNADAKLWAGWLSSHLFPGDTFWEKALQARLCIVHDNVLSFLVQTATEITARIKLNDEKKTVERGALWYEETLPAETVLAGLVIASPVKASAEEVFGVVDNLAKDALQFGGNATVGRGLCRLRVL